MVYKLSEQERLIMSEFWHSDKPLTSVDLFERLSDHFPHKPQIHRHINMLLEKGLISVCGVNCSYAKYAKYAREFKATVTEEEFMKNVLLDDINSRSTLQKIALALLEETSPKKKKEKEQNEEDQQLVEELERIIAEYKNEDD